jgi:hypothetical protein
MRKTIRIVLIAATVLAGLTLGSIAYRFLSDAGNVDACLDQGGSFDYAGMSCDHEKNHPYVAYSMRHPRDHSYALYAFTALLIFSTGLAVVSFRGSHNSQ